eukprot:GILJ01006297.1.p1 GENE.GILJ01006297.1~~GILJ01006297.1.p1  ORF type:complete len:313 (+),score=27.97 GILJ01006297.1:67-1005(+)
MDVFVEEIVLHILQWTDGVTLLKASATCKLWQTLSQQFWQKICLSTWKESRVDFVPPWEMNAFQRLVHSGHYYLSKLPCAPRLGYFLNRLPWFSDSSDEDSDADLSSRSEPNWKRLFLDLNNADRLEAKFLPLKVRSWIGDEHALLPLRRFFITVNDKARSSSSFGAYFRRALDVFSFSSLSSSSSENTFSTKAASQRDIQTYLEVCIRSVLKLPGQAMFTFYPLRETSLYRTSQSLAGLTSVYPLEFQINDSHLVLESDLRIQHIIEQSGLSPLCCIEIGLEDESQSSFLITGITRYGNVSGLCSWVPQAS